MILSATLGGYVLIGNYAVVDEAYEMYTVGDSFLHEVEKLCHPLLIQRLADWRIGGLIEAASAEGTLTIG